MGVSSRDIARALAPLTRRARMLTLAGFALAAVIGVPAAVLGTSPAAGSAPGATTSPPAAGAPAPTGRPEPVMPTAAELAGSRPDIVVIMVDDLADLDDRVLERLPTIRRLFLEQGVRFTDFIVNDPLCCPSRATFLTGLTVRHHGVWANFAPYFDPRVTLATELQAAGYTTILSGKYFNRTGALTDFRPPGWTHSLISGGNYWPYLRWVDGEQVDGTTDVDDYSTDALGRAALGWLAEAPADRPLYLQLTPTAPHSGLDRYGILGSYFPPAAPRHVGDPRCAGIRPWSPPGYNEVDVSDKPIYIQTRDGVVWPDGYPLWAVCETLLSVDELVADVEAALEAKGRTNVLYLFTSDNGMNMGTHRSVAKFTPYSVDVPLFIHWPAALGTMPRRVDELTANIDLAPTLCAVAGCTMGPYANGRPAADGVSLLPLLTGEADRLARVAVPIQFSADVPPPGKKDASGTPGWSGIRTSAAFPGGRQLYVEYRTGEREHYTLANDPWLLENDAGDPALAPLLTLLDIENDAFHGDDHAPYGGAVSR